MTWVSRTVACGVDNACRDLFVLISCLWKYTLYSLGPSHSLLLKQLFHIVNVIHAVLSSDHSASLSVALSLSPDS